LSGAEGKVSFRLDADTRVALAAWMDANAMNISQALRMLVATALRENHETYDMAFTKAAFREGVIAGIATFREKLATLTHTAVEKAFSNLDGYLDDLKNRKD
jgi:antitoxin component of RelBE/YafQ-DinJ toxin-antitoxin module